MERLAETPTVIAPPQWAIECLATLCKAVGFHETIGMGVHIGEWPDRVGVTNNPHAYVRVPLNREEPCIIMIPPWAYDGSKWHSAICHEFAHVLMRDVDKFVIDTITSEQVVEYYEKVEQSIKPFAILLMVAQAVHAEWIEDDKEDDKEDDNSI